MSTSTDHHEEEDVPAGDEEDTGAQIAPIIQLHEVAVSTGEEDEEAILDLKAKLYRFDKVGNQWKERGAGTVKFLKHKVTGKVRLVMRQSKTLKICANHLILPKMTVQEHAGNEKSCVWHAKDFADGELKDEFFCIRFASIENCRKFIETFQEIAESLNKEESKDASTAADLLENLSVEGKADAEKKDKEKSEEKTKEKETPEKESKEDTEKKVEEPASSA
ncbi:putative PH domain-containing protein [Medicago truncatula]|uniref:Putative PH domain-containing protein n=1 Tax=Medicago truncatula TaxID=3880 RepID=G7KIE5_MEDTR|nr:ran-binding protein 1 homolog b [Medicago truncatula]AES75354.1 Ran-binding protein 2, Ran-binding domain protein [Medicago truncatula]RHN51283.1 putative PH domain-containing protein [Medicago truncatula]